MIKRIPKKGYFGGVCSGIAETTQTSALAWRLIFLFAPGSFWPYVVLWILLKEED